MRGKVLVIDDDPILLEVIRDRLETAGYVVFTREDALGTSQAIAEHNPDVILLDIMMPALGGKDLAALLKRRELTRDVGIILHSSLDAEELAGMLKVTSAVGAIQKTPDSARFLAEFERLFARYRAGR
jgi:CheY-like chemotaxis protein